MRAKIFIIMLFETFSSDINRISKSAGVQGEGGSVGQHWKLSSEERAPCIPAMCHLEVFFLPAPPCHQLGNEQESTKPVLNLIVCGILGPLGIYSNKMAPF